MDYSPSQESEMSEHKQTAANPPAGDPIILIIQKNQRFVHSNCLKTSLCILTRISAGNIPAKFK